MSRALFVPFSGARKGVIKALVFEHGRLPVHLYREPDNWADPGAVAVVSNLPLFVVGGQPVYIGPNCAGRRIGYISRADAGKPALAALLAEFDMPIPANLVIDGSDWWIEPLDVPDQEDPPY